MQPFGRTVAEIRGGKKMERIKMDINLIVFLVGGHRK